MAENSQQNQTHTELHHLTAPRTRRRSPSSGKPRRPRSSRTRVSGRRSTPARRPPGDPAPGSTKHAARGTSWRPPCSPRRAAITTRGTRTLSARRRHRRRCPLLHHRLVTAFQASSDGKNARDSPLWAETKLVTTTGYKDYRDTSLETHVNIRDPVLAAFLHHDDWIKIINCKWGACRVGCRCSRTRMTFGHQFCGRIMCWWWWWWWWWRRRREFISNYF